MTQDNFEFVVAEAILVQMASPAKTAKEQNSKWGVSFPMAYRQCLEDIFEHVNSDEWLENLSDVWFLQARKGSSGIYKKGEKNWNTLLNARQAEKMDEDEVLVISMALVTEHKSYVELDYIESHVPHCGAARGLIHKLEKQFCKPIIPSDISQNMAYWSKRKDWLVTQLGKVNEYVSILGFDKMDENPQKRVCL
jgi:hypothetical protein